MFSESRTDDASSDSSILCPWEEIVAIQKLAAETRTMEEPQEDDSAAVFDPEGDADWLPGELEYYQQLCDEIYPPKQEMSAAGEELGKEMWRDVARKQQAGKDEDTDDNQE